VNTDGASTKNPIKASAGGIFRNCVGECLGCFFQFIVSKDALHVELVAAMIAIEIAYLKGFQNVWLESDSQLVNLAFKLNSVVPWCLKNSWQNCLFRLRNMRLVVSHIYREGNACVDSLPNLGLSCTSSELFWSDNIPDVIRGEYIRNRLGRPNFRFNTF